MGSITNDEIVNEKDVAEGDGEFSAVMMLTADEERHLKTGRNQHFCVPKDPLQVILNPDVQFGFGNDRPSTASTADRFGKRQSDQGTACCVQEDSGERFWLLQSELQSCEAEANNFRCCPRAEGT